MTPFTQGGCGGNRTWNPLDFMLNLTRGVGESIFIGSPYDADCIVITTDRRASYGITAPRGVQILRYPEHFPDLEEMKLSPHVREHLLKTGELR